MPDWRKRLLEEACINALGAERVHVMFRPPDRVTTMFRQYVRERFAPDEITAQVVLDDDDALANDFVARLRKEASFVDLSAPDMPFCFFSFPVGITMKLDQTGTEFFTRDIPFTNQGLTLLTRAGSDETMFMHPHKQVAKYGPARVLYTGMPSYVRTLHGENDSRGMYRPDNLTDADMILAAQRFPFLKSYLARAA